MAGKKKTNFISYELEKLNKYVKQLQRYLDDHPPDKLDDRIEYVETARGGQSIKVIATIEQQLAKFMDILTRIPPLLEDINKLRKTVEGEDEEDDVRGGHDMPGFMRKKKSGESEKKFKGNHNVEVDDSGFEDDPIPEDKKEKPDSSFPLLPGPVEDVEIIEEDIDEVEEEDPWEED